MGSKGISPLMDERKYVCVIFKGCHSMFGMASVTMPTDDRNNDVMEINCVQLKKQKTVCSWKIG